MGACPQCLFKLDMVTFPPEGSASTLLMGDSNHGRRKRDFEKTTAFIVATKVTSSDQFKCNLFYECFPESISTVEYYKCRGVPMRLP